MTLITNHTTAGAGAARARPRRARRPGRREPRLQGARRRRWRSTTATSARRASSSTTRPARPRTGATTPPAASASRSRSTAARRTTTTGDCDDPAFHPLYETMVKEWTGENPQADHTLPGAPNAGFDGKGNREAYYIAAESTLNEQRHSVLEGSAPAGATLRLTKQFKTETFPQQPDDKPLLVDDKLETVYDVGSDGRVRWHVNPSTRPIVAKATGVPNAGEPSPPQSQTGGVAGLDHRGRPATTAPRSPAGDAELRRHRHLQRPPDHGPGDRRQRLDERPRVVAEPGQRLGHQALRGHQRRRQVGERRARSSSTSQTGPSNIEEVSANGTPRLTGGQEVRAAGEQLRGRAPRTTTVDITFEAPPPFKPAQVESYTLTCEQGGRVFDTQQVQIDRGQVKQLDLSACARAIAAAGGAATPTATRPRARPRAPRPRSCARSRRAPRAAACGSRSPRSVAQRVNVDVFQVAVGRKVIGERLVARFRGKAKSFTWNGHSKRKRVQPGVLLRPLLDPTAQRPARHPPQGAAAQGRALHGAARLLPPRHLRAAALLQARARRVRRHDEAAAARRVPPHPRGERADPGAARQQGRQDAREVEALRGRPHAPREPALRRGCARATTGCRSASAARAARPRPRR